MSPNTRILFNTAASYGRSLIALVLGLFSVRWVLNAVGKEDFGLYTVVGSLIVFISFFNSLLGISIARYYAYSIGRGTTVTSESAHEDLKRWFNTALSLHLLVPILLIVVGYPLGVYAIHHWINIPVTRMDACVWVFRIAMITAFVSMASVPFIAMYTARQWIVELSCFGILSVVCNFGFAYFLDQVTSDRLIAYAIFMMIVHAGIPLAQIAFAIVRFPECRLDFSHWFDRKRLKSLLSFAGWTAFGFGGYTVGFQGIVLVTNHYYGAAINSSYGVANQLSAQTGALANALMGALAPVVTTREGAGDREGMVRVAYGTGKIGAFLLLVFAIPLGIEMSEVLHLWLKDPPDYVVPVCLIVMCGAVLDKLVMGHQMALNACGRIALWQFCQGLILSGMVIWAILFALGGVGPIAAALGYLCSSVLSACSMLFFSRRCLDMKITPWIRSVALPIGWVAGLTILLGLMPCCFMRQSFVRVCVTTAITLTVVSALAWFVLLSFEERNKILLLLKQLSRKFLEGNRCGFH